MFGCRLRGTRVLAVGYVEGDGEPDLIALSDHPGPAPLSKLLAIPQTVTMLVFLAPGAQWEPPVEHRGIGD